MRRDQQQPVSKNLHGDAAIYFGILQITGLARPRTGNRTEFQTANLSHTSLGIIASPTCSV